MKKKYGLIGYPLSHSFSPGYFKEKFKKEGIRNAEYKPYPLKSLQEFNELMEIGLTGLNVTIPYKESIMPYLDELDEVSAAIGAVNTILFQEGKLYGYNTDAYGFEQSVMQLLQNSPVNSALVLGSGGSSKAVIWVLNHLGIKTRIISRQHNYIRYDELDPDFISDHRLIVNTTPLGMYPDIEAFPPIPYNGIGHQHFCFDLVYNPEKTIFLQLSERRGARISNGLNMLKLQANKSWEIWNQM
ncbi:MAG TPA: shikimate dehydrogenase [Saprospiraceae bacterium]|nr:shikimate dehydrogenase [Saprospiraceae bacterium]